MACLGCLSVWTFDDYLVPVLAPVLIAVHRSNNLDLGDEPENKDKGYESERLSLGLKI